MGYDPVKMFTDARNAYRRERPNVAATILHARTKRPLFRLGELVPLTTWGDVMTFYSSFMAYTDPTMEQFIDLQKNLPGGLLMSGGSPANFYHTPEFNRAKAEWAAVSPFKKASSLADAFTRAGRKEIYPWSAEFWGYGSEYAKERSAAGEVPFPLELAVESTIWGIRNLPANIKKAIDTIPDIVPKLPSLTPIMEIVKWASIGGGLFMLYWYVLRPKP